VIVVRGLEEADLPSAVGIVARGMRDNPLHIAAFGTDTEQRGQRLIRMFMVALPLILSKGVVLGAFDGDTLVGIAGMIAPGQCQPSLAEKLAVMPLFPMVMFIFPCMFIVILGPAGIRISEMFLGS